MTAPMKLNALLALAVLAFAPAWAQKEGSDLRSRRARATAAAW